MEFRTAAIFSRSVTFELINEEPYETKQSYELSLNGCVVITTSKNVFSVYGLEPGQEYRAELRKSGSTKTLSSIAFSTGEERVILDVRSFGAKGDGKTVDTASLEAAIMACPEAGTVHFTKGTYLTGPLFLKSNITILLDKDAVILGLADRAAYPVLPGMIRRTDDTKKEENFATWEGNPLSSFASLITGIGVENVNIIGEGTIDGNAESGDWWEDVRTKRVAWRPKTIFLNGCRHIRMQGIIIQNSPSWTVHPYYSEHVSMYDISIYNPDSSPNTDGIDPESCHDVRIIGVRISVGDDCIALKSGKIYMGINHYKRTEDVVIRNCLLERGHGSVTIGSEMACGISGVEVNRCIFSGTDRGVRVKSRRGRGERAVVDKLSFENITMKDVLMPFTVNMFYNCDPDGHSEYVQTEEALPVDERTPSVGDITIRNVICTGVDAVFACIYGLPESPVNGIYLKNISIGFRPEEERTPIIPIMTDNFMEMSGKSFYIRNASFIEMDHVAVTGSADKEPELINVDKAKLEDLKYYGNE